MVDWFEEWKDLTNQMADKTQTLAQRATGRHQAAMALMEAELRIGDC